jgi:hypothetical protein
MPMPRDLYEKYHISRENQRRGLFEIARGEFGVERRLYPGCFVHVSPSFYIPEMVYVDSDANAARFFKRDQPSALVAREKAGREPDAPLHRDVLDFTGPIIAEGRDNLRVEEDQHGVARH